MVRVKNNIDKFGRRSDGKIAIIRGPPGIGFKLIDDKNYDIQGKCLKNVGDPNDKQDGATRDYVDRCIHQTLNAIQESSNLTNQTVMGHIESIQTKMHDRATRDYVDRCIQKTLNAVQESGDLITEDVMKRIDSTQKKLKDDYERNLDVCENALRVDMVKYIRTKLTEYKNQSEMGKLSSRVEKLEQLVKTLLK